jgi:hypothetical protein
MIMNKVVKTENEHLHASGGLLIPFEVADGITLATMQENLGYLKEEVRLHLEEGQYMHPEDYHMSMTKLIPALEVLIPYFGGTL